MSIRTEYVSLFSAFHAHGVDYVVVGGIAVNAYGYHRYTRDLDLFIRPTLENARAVHKALAQFGAPLDEIDPADLLCGSDQLRFTGENYVVDILSFIGEMPFEHVWSNRVQVEFEGLPVWFISRADLITNKLQVGRFNDLSDAEELQRLSDLETR